MKISFRLLPLFCLLFVNLIAAAKDHNIDSLASQVDKTFGIDKLKTINHLSKAYSDSSSKARYKYAKQAIELAETLIEKNDFLDFQEVNPFIEAYFLTAKAKYDKELFFDAKTNFEQVLVLDSILGKNTYLKESNIYLEKIQTKIDQGEIKENKLFKRLNRLKVGKQFKDISLKAKIQSAIQLGKTKETLGNTEGAVKHYKEAINYLKNIGDYNAINELQLKISGILSDENKEEEAQFFLEQAIHERESTLLKENVDSVDTSLLQLKSIADSLAGAKDYQQSLVYYKLYNELLNQRIEDSIQANNQENLRKKEILLLKQQKKIADLNVKSTKLEKDKQLRLKNTFLIVAALILLASLLILYFYFAKKKEHRKLNETYDTLKQTKDELEEAEQKIVTLLKQQVSVDIADKLIVDPLHKIAERHFVCILFLDIRNFTVRAEQLSPEELNTFQNNVFGFMIDVVERHHGNINQLLGDGFMATFGAPVSHGNDCQNAYNAANTILQELKQKIAQKTLPPIKIGIGLHAGNVVSGNVGNKSRMQYSITGNPVIIASRIEQLNKKFDSQLIISEEVYLQLDSSTQSTVNADFQSEPLKGRSEPTRVLVIE